MKRHLATNRPKQQRDRQMSGTALAAGRDKVELRRIRPGASALPLRRANRPGLTLLEVILALTIFVGAMAVLSELVSTGHRANLQSRLQTIAIIRAEAQMNEVVANPNLLVSTSSMPFAEEYNPGSVGQWVWSLNVQSWDQNTNLLQLELTVQHLDTSGNANATYTLRRYVRDPQAMAEAQAEADAAAASAEGSLF